MNGKTVMFKDTCLGCGQCLEVCKHGALDATEYSVKFNKEKCMLCYKCIAELDCSGDCFCLVDSDMVSKIELNTELPEQSEGE